MRLPLLSLRSRAPLLSALPFFARRSRLSLAKPEEAMTVPVRSGHRLGDLGQAAEGLAIPDETLLQDHDPLEPALPFSHQQGAGLQTDALSRLRRPPVERSGGIIVLLGAKHPLDRFVETAKGVRLEPIGQHPHQQPAREMGGRLAAQMGAPLAAQPIEIVALEIGHDRRALSVERRRSV